MSRRDLSEGSHIGRVRRNRYETPICNDRVGVDCFRAYLAASPLNRLKLASRTTDTTLGTSGIQHHA